MMMTFTISLSNLLSLCFEWRKMMVNCLVYIHPSLAVPDVEQVSFESGLTESVLVMSLFTFHSIYKRLHNKLELY